MEQDKTAGSGAKGDQDEDEEEADGDKEEAGGNKEDEEADGDKEDGESLGDQREACPGNDHLEVRLVLSDWIRPKNGEEGGNQSGDGDG
jgi:hypothetical protein